MKHDLVVIGAGVAGLALARELALHARPPLVLERARGVGGRCATRRIDGQPVDHGVAFLHGHAPRFLGELTATQDATLFADWPRVVEGEGMPCQPGAFEPRETRLAMAEGVSRFPKHLARGVDVRLDTNVVALEPHRLASGAVGWRVVPEAGDPVDAVAVALALPVPSIFKLIAPLAPSFEAIAGVLPLLELPHTLPCLTLIARYPELAPPPPWEVQYPRSSRAIQSILHDSSKRPGRPRLILVIQARPAYSRTRLDTPAETWTRELLEEAAALSGDWIARPERADSHVWRSARVDPGSELSAPLWLELDGGAPLGLAGDAFHSSGGVEGAYFSGVELARMIIKQPRGPQRAASIPD